MTGPVNEPPPGGPGRDLFGEYAEQLATVGCEVIDPLMAWARKVADGAPPLDDEQRAGLRRIFSGAR